MYSILTVTDSIYFDFTKILVKSILDKCDLTKIRVINVVSNGLTNIQTKQLQRLSPLVHIIKGTDNLNFKGGVWGEDWQTSVKSKTVYLHKVVELTNCPVLMLDSDMMVLEDLWPLIKIEGDIQVCVRPKNNVKYIGSYFLARTFKSLAFIKYWMDLTQSKTGKDAHESPSLVQTVDHFKKLGHLSIVEIDQSTVNVLEPKYLTPETRIVHFKGSTTPSEVAQLYKSRIEDRGWDTYVKKYLDNV